MKRTSGIDLASKEHRLVVVDGDGHQLEQRRISHSESGLQALIGRLLELEVARVAIEQPNGIVVDRLLEAGIAVVPVHPNQLAAARERYRSGGGKSDGFDGYVLAELARTDMHRFRVLEPDGDETRALRALTRARDDLVGQRVALANQLRAQLDAFWPGAARIFADVDSPIALCFLERCPSPEDARLLGEKRLAAFLARNGYSGRRQRRRAARPPARSARRQDRRARERGPAPDRARPGRRAQADRRADQAADQPDPRRDRRDPDGKIFRSLFRDPKSVITAAELAAEIGDRRERYDTRARLEARAGQSPVAIESGKKKVASFRWACNKTLRDAVSVLAVSSRKHNPWAQKGLQQRDRARLRPPARDPHPRTRLAPHQSGASRTTTPPTTPTATATSTASSQPGVDTGPLTPPARVRVAPTAPGGDARPPLCRNENGRRPARQYRASAAGSRSRRRGIFLSPCFPNRCG